MCSTLVFTLFYGAIQKHLSQSFTVGEGAIVSQLMAYFGFKVIEGATQVWKLFILLSDFIHFVVRCPSEIVEIQMILKIHVYRALDEREYLVIIRDNFC